MKKVISLFILLIIFSMQSGWTESPKTINHQGRMSLKTGEPIADGTYSITFKLFNVPTDGTALWTGVYDVQTKNGYYNVVLGSGTYSLAALGFEEQYYLEIRPQNETYPLTPRSPLSSSAYSFHAQHAVEAQSATVAANGVPQGTIIMHQGPNCPSGYTRLSALDGLFPRGASSYSGSQAGGADSHSHGASSSTTGAHTHTLTGTTGLVTGKQASIYPNDADGGGGDHKHTLEGATLSNGNHSHTITVNSSSNVPAYFNVIFCVKD